MGCHAGCQEISKWHNGDESEQSIAQGQQSKQDGCTWLENPGQMSPEVQNEGTNGFQNFSDEKNSTIFQKTTLHLVQTHLG